MSTNQSTVIFIVDDNPANVKVLAQVLALAGYRFLVAMDGVSGIQKITKAQPDLILLDIMMPDLDGFETCKRLKASTETHNIPIIFMTALASTADKVKGLSLGAVDYITKPFQQEEVIARIETHLKICRLTKKLESQNKQLRLEIQQRQDAEDKLKVISRATEQSPASIVITNVYGEIEYVNPKFEELTGYTLAEAKGNNPRILKTGYTLPQEYQAMWDKISAGERWYGEFQNKKKNGELYWEYASISGIKNGQGEITHYVAVKEDITQRKLTEQALLNLNQELEDRVEQRTSALKQSEKQLQQANEQLMLSNIDLARATKLKDEFLANMSHELRTPLNAILGLSEALQDGALGEIGDRQREAIQTIETSGQHLLQLINDILDIAKIESGKLELHIEDTDIKNLCNDSITFIKQIAFKKNIQLLLQIDHCFTETQNPTIAVDQLRIRQALINLLSNAVKFTSEGGSITLEVTAENPPSINAITHICFAVKDTGIGIAPEHIAKLFQPFVQIDSALNRQYMGTGLGLSLVKKIVEMHGGVVNVESKLAQGSCFMIKLPCQPLPQHLSIDSQTSNLQLNDLVIIPKNNIHRLSINSQKSLTNKLNKPHILIAEDNHTDVASICDYLEGYGYRLSLMANGEDLVEAAIANAPDLILMDTTQIDGQIDGLTAIKKIRANSELVNVPVIALTRDVIDGDREKYLEAGVNEYLTKPIKLRHLANTIQKFLHSALRST